MRYRFPAKKPSTASVKLSAIWLIHSPFAELAMPPISTHRVLRSKKNRTMNRLRPEQVHTSTLKKSGNDLIPMTTEELLPRGFAISLRCGFDPMAFQNLSDSRVRQYVAQIGYGALNATVIPRPVFFGHTDDQIGNLA